MAEPNSWDSIADARYVSLTTFRKSGDGVSTALWVAQDDDAVIMSTHADSWKVKRMRGDSHVELRPCSASGKVAPGVVPVAGHAEVIGDRVRQGPLFAKITKKYGWQQRLLAWTERRRGGRAIDRVIVRITPAEG